MTVNVEQIARVCHEANRGWCQANGDASQAAWDDAADWQRQGTIEGVKCALEGASPRELHEEWCAAKQADGWTLGEVKDADAKTHPNLVAYDSLPEVQRLKDELFACVVAAFDQVA